MYFFEGGKIMNVLFATSESNPFASSGGGLGEAALPRLAPSGRALWPRAPLPGWQPAIAMIRKCAPVPNPTPKPNLNPNRNHNPAVPLTKSQVRAQAGRKPEHDRDYD